MTPRYRVQNQKRGRWLVIDDTDNCVVVTWSNERLANSWVKEHQEDIGPYYLYRVRHLVVYQGGGMINNVRASLTLVKSA